jgi:hypothetical protein
MSKMNIWQQLCAMEPCCNRYQTPRLSRCNLCAQCHLVLFANRRATLWIYFTSSGRRASLSSVKQQDQVPSYYQLEVEQVVVQMGQGDLVDPNYLFQLYPILECYFRI